MAVVKKYLQVPKPWVSANYEAYWIKKGQDYDYGPKKK